MDYVTQASLKPAVDAAIAEDLGTGDLTAQLIPEQAQATATVICREAAVIAGIPWAEQVFKTIDPGLHLNWLIEDGAWTKPGAKIMTCSGNARSILTAERTALNFLQTLSATATATRALVDTIAHTKAQLLDTRKTLPGLRLAQKYAVLQGGGHNHRIGLYDAFLIKENHILAAGGISAAITRARGIAPATRLEIEVESLVELGAGDRRRTRLDYARQFFLRGTDQGGSINTRQHQTGSFRRYRDTRRPDPNRRNRC